MIFAPVRLGETSLNAEAVAADKKSCKRFGPCGVGKEALFLNSYFIDRRYYVAFSSVRRVFKRVAMSQGGFSGKGILDVRALLACCGGDALPEQRILSHDALEGAYLHGGFLGDVELTDTFPAAPLAWGARAHRWIRGDWQNAPWIFSRRARVLHPIDRFRLADSLRRSLVAPATWAAVFLGCVLRWPGLRLAAYAALLALAVCGILLSVSLIDAETQTIPDRLNLALAVCGAVSVLLSPADWLPHIIGALCVSVPMFLLCLVIDGAFGGGDIKLMAAAGLFLGWQNTLLAMFFGIVFGGMYGIYLLAAKKAGKKDHFAFGPFLCAGIVIAMLFGGPVLEWYCAFL